MCPRAIGVAQAVELALTLIAREPGRHRIGHHQEQIQDRRVEDQPVDRHAESHRPGQQVGEARVVRRLREGHVGGAADGAAGDDLDHVGHPDQQGDDAELAQAIFLHAILEHHGHLVAFDVGREADRGQPRGHEALGQLERDAHRRRGHRGEAEETVRRQLQLETHVDGQARFAGQLVRALDEEAEPARRDARTRRRQRLARQFEPGQHLVIGDVPAPDQVEQPQGVGPGDREPVRGHVAWSDKKVARADLPRPPTPVHC